MAKLSAKQRNALPASEFGIPETRAFPLHDKAHVLSAIKFFKHAPANKKKSLAKKINEKAKEYNMKIEAKGEFAKYIAKEVAAFYNDKNKNIVSDAYNIGTLSPIVGGMASYTPYYDDEEADLATKALAGVYRGELTKHVEEGVECLPTTYFKASIELTEFCARIPLATNLQDLEKKTPNNTNFFSRYIQDSYLRAEYEIMKHYVLNDNKNPSLVRKIENIMNSDILDKNGKLRHLFKIFLSAHNMEDIRPGLYVVYMKNRALCFKIIQMFILSKERKFAMFDMGVNSFPGGVWENICTEIGIKNPTTASFKNRDGIPLDVIQRATEAYNDNRSLIDGIFNKFIEDGTEDCRLTTLKAEDYLPMFLLTNKIDGYAFIPKSNVLIIKVDKKYWYCRFLEVLDSPALVIVATIEMPDNNYKVDTIMYKMIFLPNDSIATESYQYATESLKDKIKRMTSEFLSSLRISDEGDVKFIIRDKITFEHYEEVHKLLRACVESNNYEEMKENIAYVFSIIGMIETSEVYQHHDNRSQEYKDLIRLRALFISDFKVHYRIVMKHDSTFNFTEYYKNSKANRHLYTIKKNQIKNTVALFRALIV